MHSAVWVILLFGGASEPLKKVQCIHLPPPTPVRQSLTPGSLETMWKLPYNSQGYGNSGPNTSVTSFQEIEIHLGKTGATVLVCSIINMLLPFRQEKQAKI